MKTTTRPKRTSVDSTLEAIHAEARAIIESDLDYDKLAQLRERALQISLKNASSSYPDVLDPEFTQRLLRKKEFRQHAVSTDEDIVNRCERLDAFFEHTTIQLIVRNFMSPLTPYNGMLLAHGTGLGKTCAAITIAEQYASSMRNGVIIITRPPLVDAFQRTIFDVNLIPKHPDGSLNFAKSSSQCTGTKYPDAVADRHILSAAQLDARISRMIRDRYAFIGPLKFSNKVALLCQDSQGTPLPAAVASQRIREHFSDSVIIVDEAHMLRGGDGKKLGPALRKVLKATENVKLLLLTATPMFNEAIDIMDIVNMLLINDKRPPLKTWDVFDRAEGGRLKDEAALAAALKGYVSYAASDDPFSFPRCLSAHEANDPDALAPSQVPTRTLLDGSSIAQTDRLRHVQQFILGSPMGSAQRHVNNAITASIQRVDENELLSALADVGDEEGDDDGDDGGNATVTNEGGEMEKEKEKERKRKPDVLSKLSQLIQASNIVFPSEGKDKGKNGTFESAFVKAPGSKLRVSYRKGVEPFLAPQHISKWAPKIHAIVKRLKACQGVAMVYSRFIWSGLVPLAIAMEHAGFVPHRGAPILHQRQQQQQRISGTYAIISGQNIMESSVAQVLADATHPDNVSGKRIKVILISDKGSEGLSLKFVREVHVMEPWFHLNKVDQVMGRASRLCSHALLPAEMRNVTLFLHAIMNTDSRETIDLLTYRQAELKQAKISRVEVLIKQHAFDCNVLAPYQKRIQRAVDTTRVTIVTSQGRVLKNRSLESARVTGTQSGAEQETRKDNGRCVPDLDVTKLPENASTYDPSYHAHHEERYRSLLGEYFAETKTTSATAADLWAYVKRKMPLAEHMECLRELRHIVTSHSTISSAQGRQGYIMHRGKMYLFQPFDEESVILTDAERSAPPLPHTHVKAAAMFAGPAKTSSSATNAYLRHDDRIHHAIKVLTRISTEASERLHGILSAAAYENVALDAVIDGLTHADLLDVAKAVLVSREVHDLLPSRVRSMKFAVRRSLIIARILPPTPNAAWIRSPYFPDQAFQINDEGTFSQTPLPPNQRQKATTTTTTSSLVASIARINNNTRTAFKVLDPLPPGKHHQGQKRGAVRSGCVCHQSSTVSQKDLVRLISDMVPDIKQQLSSLNKRALCEVYEICLRKHRPSTLLRPM
jgi:hypothetical protein